MIDIDKKYRTRNGLAVEIFKVIKGPYPNDNRVLGAIIDTKGIYTPVTWNTEGSYWVIPNHASDLIEVSPYGDFKIDDKVLVWNDMVGCTEKRKRYFAGVNEYGRPTTFVNGATSWTASSDCRTHWDNCEKFQD